MVLPCLSDLEEEEEEDILPDGDSESVHTAASIEIEEMGAIEEDRRGSLPPTEEGMEGIASSLEGTPGSKGSAQLSPGPSPSG
jgi:hypothetical protein